MNLRKWRTDNGLTSQEWEYYEKVKDIQTLALMLMSFVIGFMGGLAAWN